jgi:hypothetical protein
VWNAAAADRWCLSTASDTLAVIDAIEVLLVKAPGHAAGVEGRAARGDPV